MAQLALGLLILFAVVILILIIGTLGVWLRGVNTMALPGLGIILSTALVVILLLVIETVVVIVAALLVRRL